MFLVKISLLVVTFPSPYITGFDIKVIHQRIQATSLHASCCHHCHHCHYCNIDFVFFHNVAPYTNSLLSCIHVNTADLLNITCTLVTSSMILGKLECSPPSPPFLLTIMSRMVNKLWTRNAISFHHMSFWGPFLDSHPTIHHSNISVGVPLR